MSDVCLKCDERDAVPGTDRCAECQRREDEDGPQDDAHLYGFTPSYAEQQAAARSLK